MQCRAPIFSSPRALADQSLLELVGHLSAEQDLSPSQVCGLARLVAEEVVVRSSTIGCMVGAPLLVNNFALDAEVLGQRVIERPRDGPEFLVFLEPTGRRRQRSRQRVSEDGCRVERRRNDPEVVVVRVDVLPAQRNPRLVRDPVATSRCDPLRVGIAGSPLVDRVHVVDVHPGRKSV